MALYPRSGVVVSRYCNIATPDMVLCYYKTGGDLMSTTPALALSSYNNLFLFLLATVGKTLYIHATLGGLCSPPPGAGPELLQQWDSFYA